MKDYVEKALRTESYDFEVMKERLQNEVTIRLLHSAMGISTEAGELLDMLKKHIFYGKPIDFPNAKEEIGDALWYSAIAIDVLKTTLDEVMSVNIEKLKARYPEKFTSENALNRDLKKERIILEQQR